MSDKITNINWYPGHMAKARREMQSDVKLVDMVVELLDARAPLSSRNPEIDKIAGNKFRLVLLNKADLADEATNRAWISYFEAQGITCIALDSRKSSVKKPVVNAIMKVAAAKFERDRAKGILNRPVRVMVCGIPNVGKSTLINSVAGRASTKTGNKPGVTKANQWIKLNKQVELLDTPGLLWPKFEDPSVGIHLAFLGSINDDILEKRELAMLLIDELCAMDRALVAERYNISCEGSGADILEDIAKARLVLKKGGEPDYDRTALIVIDDFRNCRMGRISLERPAK
ncbi:MAG: ribosome biogenesis GTPase YlqF [Lachnospiraceae bacterium]|nr:ribosome biogenesis GTPase YlqF [Lachnospiraceae bacterium]